jgi:hypothetical protein
MLPIVWVAGCSLSPTVDGRGPASLASVNYQLPALPGAGDVPKATSPGLVGNFELAYARAQADALKVAAGVGKDDALQSDDPKCTATNGSCSRYSVHSRQMALTGVSLADQNCDNFFDALGKVQQYVLFSRDILGSAGTIGAGAAGLISGAAAAPASVGFAIATANTGIDAYSRNFLFGADNIDSVKSLVGTAESVHTTAALPENDTSAWTFEQAQQVVMDHQDICAPAHVLLLTRAAIANGKVTAFDDQGKPITTKSNPGDNTSGGTPPKAPAPATPQLASQLKLPQPAQPATPGGTAAETTFQNGRPATRRVMLRVVPGG